MLYNSYGQDRTVKVSPAILFAYFSQSHLSANGKKEMVIFQIPVTYNKFYSELRFNYDQSKTWGLFGGRKWRLADSDQILTPQLGILFGSYRGTGVQVYYNLARPGFEVNSQNEYILSFQKGGSYYFNWSEVKFIIWKKLLAVLATEYYNSRGSKSLNMGLAFGYRSKIMTYYFYVLDLYKLRDSFLYAGFQKTINFSLLHPSLMFR